MKPLLAFLKPSTFLNLDGVPEGTLESIRQDEDKLRALLSSLAPVIQDEKVFYKIVKEVVGNYGLLASGE